MNQPQLTRWKIKASLLSAAWLALAGTASAALVVTATNENGALPFTPTWTPASGSLIAGLAPTFVNGRFNLEDTNREISSLTGGGSLTINVDIGNADDSVGHNTTTTNYLTFGNGGGACSMLVYTLPAAANGYNVTNISVYNGWADNGRDAQAYTVSYSTVANPGNFIYLTNVSYNPTVPAVTPSANLVSLFDSAGGAVASNVAAIQFDFTCPPTENGFTGYGAITVQGTPATVVAPPAASITASNENGASPFTPDWVLETDSLIAGAAPSTATGNFIQESAGGTSVLTDGVIGNSGDATGFATCGSSGGNSLVYTLTNSVNGSDVTNIVLYSGWGNNNRDGQYYLVSYSTVSAPSTFIPVTTVYYNPVLTNGNASANRVAISSVNGVPLGRNVNSVKFDFGSPAFASSFDNAYVGYSEIIIEGYNSQPPTAPPAPYLIEGALPNYAETVVGDSITFTTTFSNSPAAAYQWLYVNGGVTNVIPGATATNLTLNNLQLTNTGTYVLEAFNATNHAGVTFSSPSFLAISNVPAAVSGVVVDFASQAGLGVNDANTNFYPTWAGPSNSLIAGANSGDGSLVEGSGNFGMGQSGGDPTILTDGSIGYVTYWPGVGSNPSEVSCGIDGAGESVAYNLPNLTVNSNGYDITNIVVYGGWGDSGRNEQKYEVLYATVAAPGSFVHLANVDYNPNNPNSGQSATRTTLIPATGALAQNVAALEFNFNLQGDPPKNGWEGYSEIAVAGTPSAPKPVLSQDITPLTAADVVGSQLIITAAFTSASPMSYQWQKNGTNIAGATTSVLTLNNLQLSDTATNGGYVLVASNSSGSSATRGCSVTVNPVPAPSNNVVTSFAYQTSDQGTFTPTWDTTALSASLIFGSTPSDDGSGDFFDPDVNPLSNGRAGGTPILTDGGYGAIVNDGTHPAFATCGPSAGQYVTYTLGANANGYNITNIIIAGGWNDGGRDSQWYTVSYSTVGNPLTFLPIAVVTNSPVVTDKSVIRATFTPAAGVIASNVYEINVDFTTPAGVPNGYSGYSEISVFGSPANANSMPANVTVATQSPDPGTSPSWIIETNSLIEGQLPSSTGPGAYAGSFNNDKPAGGLPVLTDGAFGPVDNSLSYATCGGAYGAGSSITYTCPSGSWTLTNIVVYSGWANFNRDGQFYNVSYSTLSAPDTFVPLVTVNYNPAVPYGVDGTTTPSANRVDIAPANGIFLATNVYAVTFDFTPQTGNLDNGYSGYAEIVLQGTNAPSTVVGAPKISGVAISGGTVILTGSGGTEGSGYTLLTSTNLVGGWTTDLTGTFGPGGSFSNGIPVNATNPAVFFRLRSP
jgi:hypothetical protein